ncbi:putative DNA-binding domain-containing protein [Emcibacter sp.]|uniref:HvfC/BufC family peptide modification chaperone n=1 Tax=Emcibacter sp. TaxID=1979954 RepID=UPI003A8DE773
MKLARLQLKFRGFLLEGDAAPLTRHIRNRDHHAEERLMIHHNNCLITLEEVLAANFPVLCRLVGRPFFRQLARSYIREHPPQTPVLAEYGQYLPDFIAGRRELASHAYLQDMARLEVAWNRTLHGRDEKPQEPADLEKVDLAEPDQLLFRFLPSLELVTSRFPLLRIWNANRDPVAEADEISLDEGPDHIILSRPEWRVHALSVEPWVFELVRLLREGESLGRAVSSTVALFGNFQLPEALAVIFSNRLVTDIFKERKK